MGIIIPTDEPIFFRGVGQPPTRFRWGYKPTFITGGAVLYGLARSVAAAVAAARNAARRRAPSESRRRSADVGVAQWGIFTGAPVGGPNMSGKTGKKW